MLVPKLANGAWSSFTVELLSSVEALTLSGTDSRKHSAQPNPNGQCEKPLWWSHMPALACFPRHTIWRDVSLSDLVSASWLPSLPYGRMVSTTQESDPPPTHTHFLCDTI